MTHLTFAVSIVLCGLCVSSTYGSEPSPPVDKSEYEYLIDRIEALEFQPLTKRDVDHSEVNHLLLEFREEWRDSIAVGRESLIEVKYMREQINRNADGIAILASRVSKNEGRISGNETAITLNRSLLVALAGLILWVVRKIKEVPKSPESGPRIITSGNTRKGDNQ